MENRQKMMLVGLAAVAGLAYFLKRKTASTAASLAATGDTANTVAGWSLPGAIPVSAPVIEVPDPSATAPTTQGTGSTSLASSPAATSPGFSTGGGTIDPNSSLTVSSGLALATGGTGQFNAADMGYKPGDHGTNSYGVNYTVGQNGVVTYGYGG